MEKQIGAGYCGGWTSKRAPRRLFFRIRPRERYLLAGPAVWEWLFLVVPAFCCDTFIQLS
jgi:hypothetical protein